MPYRSFCVVNGSLSSQELGVGTTISRIQRSSRTRRWHCERWFRSTVSQMTAAIVMDVVSRLPRCAGQAADAVSAYTQVKMEDAPSSIKIPKSECPDIWIRLPKHTWRQSWSWKEESVVPLERNLYGHPLGGLLWERQFEKILLQHGWGDPWQNHAVVYTVGGTVHKLTDKTTRIHPRTKSNYRKEKDPSRGQNLDCNSWMTDVEEILFEMLIFK